MMPTVLRLIASCALVLLFTGCPTGSDCETCLASGGTWQPEVSECTANCDLADISCFEDECPGACEAGACDNCFSRSRCLDADCNWNTDQEAAWCGE